MNDLLPRDSFEAAREISRLHLVLRRGRERDAGGGHAESEAALAVAEVDPAAQTAGAINTAAKEAATKPPPAVCLAAALVEACSCSVCLDVFVEPHVTPCGHSFCRRCAVAAVGESGTCPTCRGWVELADLRPNFSCAGMMAVQFACPNAGCGAAPMSVADFAEHLCASSPRAVAAVGEVARAVAEEAAAAARKDIVAAKAAARAAVSVTAAMAATRRHGGEAHVAESAVAAARHSPHPPAAAASVTTTAASVLPTAASGSAAAVAAIARLADAEESTASALAVAAQERALHLEAARLLRDAQQREAYWRTPVGSSQPHTHSSPQPIRGGARPSAPRSCATHRANPTQPAV